MKKCHDKQVLYKRAHDTVTVIGTLAILALIIVDVQVPSAIYWTISLALPLSVTATWVLYRKHGGQAASRKSILGALLLGLCIILLTLYIKWLR